MNKWIGMFISLRTHAVVTTASNPVLLESSAGHLMHAVASNGPRAATW